MKIFGRLWVLLGGQVEGEGSVSMEHTVWTEQNSMKGRRTKFPFGSRFVGLLAVAIVVVTMYGCKASSTEERSRQKANISIKEYWKTLFKNDPESQKEFERIKGEFRTGKRSLALRELEELLKRSPQAPWVEAVEFYRAQAWTLLRRYGDAIRQFDLLLQGYPQSPAVPWVLASKGQVYLAMGKQSMTVGARDPVGDKYLEKAKELFRQVWKGYPENPEIGAEALFMLGDAAMSLQELDQAKEAFRKAAETYPDSAYGGKSLYALAGLHLRDGDMKGTERVYKEIMERYPDTRLAKKAGQKLAGIHLVGSQAPALQVKEWIGEPPPEGGAYRSKLTLLSFWSIWCPHCRRNIPKMEHLLATYGEKGVSVVGITRDREGQGVDQIREYITSHPMTFPTGVDDDGKTSQEMLIVSIPCVVAVDSQGRIRWHGHPDQLSEKVIEMLLQPSS
jgi:TolA-binding protein/peroxiredoxin